MLEESSLVAIQVNISLFALLDTQICQSGISEVHLQQVKTILYPFHNFSNLSRVKELDDLCFILYTLNCFCLKHRWGEEVPGTVRTCVAHLWEHWL